MIDKQTTTSIDQPTNKQVGVITQEAMLFSGTVRENIAYARPDASEAEIREAAVLANAHECVGIGL